MTQPDAAIEKLPTFFRLTTDDNSIPAPHLSGSFAASFPSPVWLIGGGPSLRNAPLDLIRSTPAPKFCMNLAGSGLDGEPPLIRPDIWSAYDPSARFHKSVYLDPGILKLITRTRRMDLIPGTTWKVCDAPNVYFFERKNREYTDFIGGPEGIVDARDTFCQCIDLCFRLGFRTIFLLGTEMQITPSAAQISAALAAGVRYDIARNETTYVDQSTNNEVARNTLQDFVQACRQAGMMPKCDECGGTGKIDGAECANCEGSGQKWRLPLGEGDRERQYSFTETKPFQAAVNTDTHYFTVAQYLRLARRSFADRGLRIVSCTPKSRLNDIFPYLDSQRACAEIFDLIGDPRTETTAGNYQDKRRPGEGFGHTVDIPPYKWPAPTRPVPPEAIAAAEAAGAGGVDGRRRYPEIAAELERIKSKPIEIEEEHG